MMIQSQHLKEEQIKQDYRDANQTTIQSNLLAWQPFIYKHATTSCKQHNFSRQVDIKLVTLTCKYVW